MSFLLILALNLNSYFVDNIEFEELLGKHISNVEKTIGSDFEKNNFEKIKISFYSNSQYFNIDFYGIFCNHLTIQTNEKDIVQSISIHFREVITREFYDSFIQQYGEPNNIQVIENRRTVSESFGEGFYQHLRKSTFDLREGTFDENPLYIIWEKEHFQIKAFLRHKMNISEITFSIPIDKS